MSADEFYSKAQNQSVPLIPVLIQTPSGAEMVERKISFIGGIFRSMSDNIVEALVPQSRIETIEIWDGFRLIEPSKP